jgi:hypothetical protein
MLTIGAGAAVALHVLGIERWWALGLFFPFWGGATGVLQAHEKT